MREKKGNGDAVDMEQFMDDIKAVVRDGQELLRAGVGTLKARARAGFETTDHLAHDRPYKGIALAFSAGLVAGLLAASCWGGRSEVEED